MKINIHLVNNTFLNEIGNFITLFKKLSKIQLCKLSIRFFSFETSKMN